MSLAEQFGFPPEPQDDENERFLAALVALPPTPVVEKSKVALAALENAGQAVDEDPVTKAVYDRLWQAIVLAPSIDVCEELLHKRPVPESRLDPEWMRRLGAL